MIEFSKMLGYDSKVYSHILIIIFLILNEALMPNLRRALLLGLTLIPLSLLAACDGYVMVAYDGEPYGDRTAGKGVQYVLAKMMPTKPVNDALPAAELPVEEPIIEAPPPPLSQADMIFDAKAKK
jgi:hypothetical protein